MRPKSIVNFERTVLASLALSVLGSAVSWERASTMAADAGLGTGYLIGVAAFTLVLTLLLLWFIARKGSPIAKWIYVVVAVLGFIGGVASIGQVLEYGALSAGITILSYILSALSLWFLFRPDANAWFNDGRGEA
jgi:formate-dependent nitrite reductase membrane component NrfD